VEVVLVTREGCHLCDQALSALRSLGHEPQLRDVDADAELLRLYDWRVPVVLVGDRVIAEGKIDRDRLKSAIGSRP
jgi:predicted thioredoxin/glutaredoxin